MERTHLLDDLLMAARSSIGMPKQGLEYLFDQNIIGRSPEDVAKFFIDQNHNLSKHAVGTYIGEISKEFNMKVLDAFSKLHNFKDEEFLPALRQFLFSFQLPGESQKIDRILTSFSERYVEQNPSVFNSPRMLTYCTCDICYFLLLSFWGANQLFYRKIKRSGSFT
ncbi:unnamed protein product [Schistosoma turkestanicum]|nr:unnamed protein product [Schistosoma turkestanicum]